MKVASLDVVIWVIVFAAMALAKGWGKLQKQIDKDSSESKPAPPVAPARRSATAREGGLPKPQRPRPQMRPMASPMARTVPPSQRAAPGTARPPVGSPMPREAWRIDSEQIRRFVDQMSGQTRQPVPPPVAQPRVHKAEATAPPAPEPAAPIPKHTIAKTPPPPKASRASQWAEALGDKQNIRNIIISAEIIGPPKAV